MHWPGLNPFYFVSVRRPPTSPLFPYTTLFRSSLPRWVHLVVARALAKDPAARFEDGAALERGAVLEAGDRKSTRLNSSHTVISYAVFCLKKKKNTPMTQTIGYERQLVDAVAPT